MARLSAATACLLVLLLGAAYGREAEDARLIAARSTVTVISVSTTIVSVPFTCRKALSTQICGGGRRRRRSAIQAVINNDRDTSGDSLDASLKSKDQFEVDFGDEQARLQVTIWSTSTTPFTFTTTTTAGITLSLSYQCSLPLQSYPPACP